MSAIANSDVPVPGAVGGFDRRTLYAHERAALDAAFAEVGGARPDLRLLDIGCGRGRTTVVLADDYRVAVEAFDIDPAIVEDAKRERPDIAYSVGDATDLSRWADGSFDVVLFSFNGLDYVPSTEGRRSCFAEAARVLKPGGAFVYSSHNRGALLSNKDARRILRRNLWRVLTGVPHLQERSRHWVVDCWHGTPASEEAMAREYGLRLLDVFSRGRGGVTTDRAAASGDHWPYYVAVKD